MRSGPFEFTVVRADGSACPEVTHNGKTYVVAAPGETFDLKCTWHSAYPRPEGRAFNFFAKVDGQEVGTSLLLRRPNDSQTFKGFLNAGDASSATFTSFVFAKPKEDARKAAHNLDFGGAGRLTCEVWDAVQGAPIQGPAYGPAALDNSIAKLPEGKKFFLAPSLTTARGALKHSTGLSTVFWNKVGVELASFELRYETASTLLLRGVLKRGVPEHRAILGMSDETRQQGEEEEEADSGARRRRQQQQQQRIKREREEGPSSRGGARVKREAGGGGQEQRQPGGEGSGDSEVIDLTAMANENDEVAAARRQDKVLLCDLTAEEAPAWRAEKKQVIQL
eukprot:scaffold14.g1109.t1